MKIIDSFIFYNELDLLTYRLSILNAYVDSFILVESTHTFAGNPKPLYYNENKELFAEFNYKIIHIIVDTLPHKAPHINFHKNHQWENEYYQRNQIKRGIDTIKDSLGGEDIIFTSDVDEIPNPTVLANLKDGILTYDRTSLNRLALDMYYYNLCFRLGEGTWHGIKLMTVAAYTGLRLTFQEMRTYEFTHHVPIVPNGGWHLSYFGDIEFIKNKIKNFAHQEFNNDSFLNKKGIDILIKKGINIFDDSQLKIIAIELNNNLPPLYDIYLKKFLGM